MTKGRDPTKNIVRIRYGDQERFLALDGDEFLIGRDEGASIRIPLTAVSRRHALVRVVEGRVTVRDLGSSNGTFVGGTRIKRGEETELKIPGEEFALGNSVHITVQPRSYESESAPIEQTETAPPPGMQISIADDKDLDKELIEISNALPDRSSFKVVPAPSGEDHDANDVVIAQVQLEPPHLTQEMQKELSRSVRSPVQEPPEADDSSVHRPPPHKPPAHWPTAHRESSNSRIVGEPSSSISVVKTGTSRFSIVNDTPQADPATREREQEFSRSAIEERAPTGKMIRTHEIELAGLKNAPALETAIRQLKEQAEALKSEVWDLKAKRVQCERELGMKKKELETDLTELEAKYSLFKREAAQEEERIKSEATQRRESIEREVREKSQTFESDFEARRTAAEREFREKSEKSEAEFEERRAKVERELRQKQENLELMIVGLRARQGEAEREYGTRKETLTAEVAALREEQTTLDTELNAKREFVRRAISDLDKAKEKTEQDHQLACQKAESDYEARQRKGHQDFNLQEKEWSSRIAQYQAKDAELRESVETMTLDRDALVREAQRAKAMGEQEIEKAAEHVKGLRADAHATQSEIDRSRETLGRVREELEQLTRTLGQLQESRDSVQTQIQGLQAELPKVEFALKEQREAARRETETREYEIRKTRAHFETLEAEFQVKKLNLDAGIGETLLRQMEARQELQMVLSRRDETALEVEKLKSGANREVAAAQERLENIRGETQKLEEDFARRRTEVARAHEEAAQANATLAELKGRVETSLVVTQRTLAEQKKSEAELNAFQLRCEAEKAQVRARVEAEYQVARKEMEVEFTHTQKTLAAELAFARKNVEAELLEARQNSQKMIETEVSLHRRDVEQSFKERANLLEREIADIKIKKLNEIENLQSEAAALERSRRDYMLNEIVRGAVELSQQRVLVESDGELRKVVRAVLEGKTVGALSVEATIRTERFWRKVGTYCAIPVAAVLIFVLFPGIPGWFTDHVKRTIASEKKDGGTFLDEIHQKGMKFQPPTDHEYRETYWENILYVEGYPEMKLDESEQKKWIVVLNDFIVGRLGLSDRVIPGFIASEDILVKELLSIRKGMLPQFKEQGLIRLADAEREERAKLVAMLESEENYRKFRDLERSYYVKYVQDHSHAH
jgi:pSer/pThr/pTyr-binding forkhead associated (FHA) protein